MSNLFQVTKEANYEPEQKNRNVLIMAAYCLSSGVKSQLQV